MSLQKKRGFGPDQVVDLGNYENRWTAEEIQSHVKRGKFIGFRFLDLKKYAGDYLHEELYNIAIRADGNRGNADITISQSYEKKGWRYDPFPPIIDVKENVKDGRTRIRAAIIKNETFIPVAVYDYPEETDEKTAYVQCLSEGLIGNDDLLTRPTKYGDLLEAGISAVTDGNIEHDKTEIIKLLQTEFEAERFIDSLDIPVLADDIFDAVSGGKKAIWDIDRKDVLEYLRKSPDLPADACLDSDDICLNGKRVFVYAAPSDTNRGRLWGMISREIPQESYVVLYTTKKIPSKIKKGYDEFMEYIDWRYKECFEIVNRTFEANGQSMIKIKSPTKKPWKVLGVIPQLNMDGDHDKLRLAKKLIKLEEYC
tara:strand:+ start:137 stop:1240 length:1104 start_codon:yes stop_codon:yes gene_type:complete